MGIQYQVQEVESVRCSRSSRDSSEGNDTYRIRRRDSIEQSIAKARYLSAVASLRRKSRAKDFYERAEDEWKQTKRPNQWTNHSIKGYQVTDNVIRFPKAKMNTPPQSLDDMIADMERMRLDHADEVASSMIPQLIGLFMANGIDVDQHEYIKDVSMIVESTKSLLYKYMNIEHPFHEMVESVFDFNYNEDDTVSYKYTLPSDMEEEWRLFNLIW